MIYLKSVHRRRYFVECTHIDSEIFLQRFGGDLVVSKGISLVAGENPDRILETYGLEIFGSSSLSSLSDEEKKQREPEQERSGRRERERERERERIPFQALQRNLLSFISPLRFLPPPPESKPAATLAILNPSATFGHRRSCC
ncbi:hypothetical protein L7F22_054843 [Adiantum nelumboides]|nr:hypothetical protein [Adiantum nelumboides]